METYPLAQSPKLPSSAFAVWKKLRESGYHCLCAGGFVRDFLLNQPSEDVDLATSATPQQVSELFARTLPLGKRFGSVVVLVEEEGITHAIEVTTFRSDGIYLDGRRPESITASNPEEDAKRRDFTINGLFYDPENQAIIDYVQGLKDLEEGILKAIGDPWKRFEEDRLRILRGVRFACRLGYSIEQTTFEAMRSVSYSVSHCVSPERIWQELVRIDGDQKFNEAMTLFHQLGLLSYLFHLELEESELSKRLNLIRTSLPLVLKLALLWDHQLRFSHDCTLALSHLKLSRRDLFLLEQMEKGLHWLDTLDHPLQSIEAIQWVQKSADDLESLCFVLSQIRSSKADALFWQQLLSHPLTVHLCEEGPLFKAQDLKPYHVPSGRGMGQLLQWLHEQAALYRTSDKTYILSLLENSDRGQKRLQEAQKGQSI